MRRGLDRGGKRRLQLQSVGDGLRGLWLGLDNRLSQVEDQLSRLTTEYAYDYQGARILRRDNDGTRTRYFFHVSVLRGPW